MPNKRISDLDEKEKLSSANISESFPSGPNPEEISNAGPEEFLLLAVEGSRNEKISYPNIKISLLDASVSTHTDQIISGSKRFSGGCTFEKNIEHPQSMEIPSLSTVGSKAVDSLFVDDISKTIGGANEIHSFSHPIKSGESEVIIDLKKSLINKPIISCSLLHQSGGQPIPFSIKDITNKSFKLNLNSPTADGGYSANITVAPSQQEGFLVKDTQRFVADLTSGAEEHTINFLNEYQSAPAVSVTIECNSQSISHIIKDITTSNFKLVLNTQSPTDTKAHIIISKIGTTNGI
jgi:hypothetical protein